LLRCLCALLAYMMLLTPVGLQSLAQADILYSQLRTLAWGKGNTTITYTYDDNGSVETKVVDDGNTETFTYVYNLQNRLESVNKEYDLSGDTINEVTEYTYNDNGIRVKSYYYKTINGGAKQNEKTIIYLVDQYNHTGYAQVLEELTYNKANPDPSTETPDSTTTYTIGDDVIAQDVDGTSKYLLYDGHGSTRQLADSTGTVAENYSYDGYGVMLGANANAADSAGTGMLYAGEQFDTSLQMYYNRARYYDQNIGRFNRMDPYAGNYQDPQSLHKYLYCHANPVNEIDPSGMMLGGGSYSLSEVLMVSAIMGVLAGMVTYEYTRSMKAAVIVGVSIFMLTFIGLGGIGLLHAALTGGVVSSPHLLNPNSWQEAESMLGRVLQLPKNTFTYFVQGMQTGRRPDFIAKGQFIADSKWRYAVYMSDQLRDFETLAKAWNVSLYLYVRVGTHVSDSVVKLVERTNGLIIRIFE